MGALLAVLAQSGCSAPAKVPPRNAPAAGEVDPAGAHRAAVAAQVQPYLDSEIVSGVVVGLYDVGKLEIYGFGKGPAGKPPNGHTLYELGSITKVYTNLLLADAVQRREVELDTPVAELLPPGVTVPTRDKTAITLKHLALHSSGLPKLPPSLVTRKVPPDPYASYGEDALYQDLIGTELVTPPGTQIAYSNYGAGLLGFALGRKLGAGYAKALETRVLAPLGLRETFVTVAASAGAHRMLGTDDDLRPAPRWTWGALAGAGVITSTARDQLRMIDLELDAAAGSKGPMRPQLRLTQEPQLENDGDNQSLGWMIDPAGRYWHNGGTGGFRSYISFDPKTKRGVVVLASTATTLVDFLGRAMVDVLDGTAKPPPARPTPVQRTSYVGKYDFTGTVLSVVVADHRLYLEGPGEPRHRMAPITDRAFWIEGLQAAAQFVVGKDGAVENLVFKVGDRQIVAPRTPGQ
ncbi:MAG: serine hydrolase [Deltaproteobacteria bacterium]|nr:serine hydrolase [Deltaproteobacteria bacterium]